MRQTNKERYLKHKVSIVAAVHRHQQRLRVWMANLKSAPCMDCGYTFPPCVMDWDHRDPTTKLFGVGGSCYGKGRQTILDEIAKCDLVCANCHRIRTHMKCS